MGTKQSSQVLTDAVDELSQQIYHELVKTTARETHGNIIYSPFQCYMTIFILYSATEGQTKRELETLLHLIGKTNHSSVQNAILHLLRDVPHSQITCQKLAMKFRLGQFVTRDYTDQLQPQFLKILTTFGNTFELQFVDFSNVLLKCIVDCWSKECTNGRITCCTGRQIPATPLFHVNLFAIVDQIDLSSTHAHTYASDMMFHDSSNSVSSKAATCIVGSFMYIHDVTYKMRVVQFLLKSNPLFNVLIVLPEKRNGLNNDKFKRFMHEQIRMWLESLTVESELEIWLPRIKTASTIEMRELFEKLSASSLFNERADFSGMARLKTTSLYLSSLHANYHLDLSVEVNEENRRDINEIEDDVYHASLRIPFRVEHPFMVLIVHRLTKTVFLTAHIQNVS